MSLTLDTVGLTLSGHRVLDAVTLRLADGEQAALIGPSGAGKSSLLLTAATRYRPDAGRVTVLGQQPWALSAHALRTLRSQVSSAYQATPLPSRQRVATAVAAGRLGLTPAWRALLDLVSPRDVAGIAAALARVELEDRLWARCDALSGGQRQRVGLARLLYQAPRLMLADEPVSALDPLLAERTVRLLVDDARARGATLLMSLHSVQLALAHFPRLIGMRAGRIVFDLPRERVDHALLNELYAGEAATAAESAPTAASPVWGSRC